MAEKNPEINSENNSGIFPRLRCAWHDCRAGGELEIRFTFASGEGRHVHVAPQETFCALHGRQALDLFATCGDLCAAIRFVFPTVDIANVDPASIRFLFRRLPELN